MKTRPISEEDLHAWADSRLDGPRLAQVEAWLAEHPEQRATAETWRAQSAQLRRAYNTVLDEPIPARLLPPANEPRWFDVRRLAMVGWISMGFVAGYFLRGVPDQPAPVHVATAVQNLPHMAAVAHAVFVPEVRHPVEVGADQEAHLIGWLSKRLGVELRPPQLDAAGYRLVGGRLLPGDSGEVAQFMYENTSRQRLTLYVRPGSGSAKGESGFRYARENGIDVFYWIDGHLGYALSGDTGRASMLAIAELVYRQHAK